MPEIIKKWTYIHVIFWYISLVYVWARMQSAEYLFAYWTPSVQWFPSSEKHFYTVNCLFWRLKWVLLNILMHIFFKTLYSVWQILLTKSDLYHVLYHVLPCFLFGIRKIHIQQRCAPTNYGPEFKQSIFLSLNIKILFWWI
jgi:hypothetical protein